MAHVSDFTQAENKIILDLINFDNESNLALEQVSLAAPSFAEGKVTVVVDALPGSGYVDSVDVTYGRLDLQAFVDVYFPDALTIVQGDAVNISELLGDINTALGTAIPADNITDGLIVPAQGWPEGQPPSIDLLIKATSLVYQGSASILIDIGLIELSTVITQKVLTGLNLPVVAGPTLPEPKAFTVNSASFAGDMFLGYQQDTFGSIDPVGATVDATDVDNDGLLVLQALHYEPSNESLVLFWEAPEDQTSAIPFTNVVIGGRTFNKGTVETKEWLDSRSLMKVSWANVAENPLPVGPVAVSFQ